MKLSCIKSRARSRFTSPQGCRNQRGPGGPWPPQILADQLTLSQPGGQIIPTPLLIAPTPLGILDFPMALRVAKRERRRSSSKRNIHTELINVQCQYIITSVHYLFQNENKKVLFFQLSRPKFDRNSLSIYVFCTILHRLHTNLKNVKCSR